MEKKRTLTEHNSTGRILVVGSLFGGVKALRKCLLLSKYDASKDKLIFLGDYTGSLDEAPTTIEWLTWLRDASKYKPVFITGETDRWLGAWINTGKTNLYWVNHLNGRKSIEEYMSSELMTSERHREFFDEMHPYYRDMSTDTIYASAGFPEGGIGDHDYISSYYMDKTFWAHALHKTKRFEISKRGNPKELRFYKYRQIFISKAPTLDNIYTDQTIETKQYGGVKGQVIDKPMKRHTVFNINTGVNLTGGFLTVMDSETHEFWQAKNI